MKYGKLCFLLLAGVFAASLILSGCSVSKAERDANKLIIFNYGDYLDMDTVYQFEEETGIEVEYEEYVAPEDMYTKYQSGAINYDLICTSDYMIQKMINNGEVLAIDKENLEYYDLIDERYLNMCEAFDPGNVYSIPQFFGTVGIIYNTDLVEDEVDSWEIMWDSSYKNQIVMENSMRDAFIAPLKLMGESLNTKDKDILDQGLEMLEEQKEILMAYLVDETRDIMIAEDAALGQIYSGDATVAIEQNDSLEYVIPEEGSNIWFDSWVIPETCQHKENAEKFIDFMNRPDIAEANFEYVYYGTANTAVYEEQDDDVKEDPTVFPSDEILGKCEVFNALGDDMDAYYTQLWKKLKSY